MATCITGVTGLLGAVIGSSIAFLAQRADRKDRTRGELGAAVVAFGYALDSLHTELTRIPRSTGLARLTDQVINTQRLPNLNRLLLWANSKTIGRDAERAIDRFMSAANRVMVLAPLELLPVVERANQLLTRAAERDDTWEEQWWAMRAELTVQTRKLVGTKVIESQSAARSSERDAAETPRPPPACPPGGFASAADPPIDLGPLDDRLDRAWRRTRLDCSQQAPHPPL